VPHDRNPRRRRKDPTPREEAGIWQKIMETVVSAIARAIVGLAFWILEQTLGGRGFPRL
jgi:hypothetical protein